MNRSNHSLSGAVAIGLFLASIVIIGAVTLGITEAQPRGVCSCE